MTSNNPTIAIIDDEEMIRYALQRKLLKQGYSVISAEKAEEVLYLIKSGEKKIDLIITDIMLRKMDGIEFLRYINAMENPIPVLILTAQAHIEDAIRALRYGACDFIRKPCDVNEIASAVRGIIRARQEKQLADTFGQYILYDRRIFRFGSDLTACNVLSYKLTKHLPSTGFCNKTTAENISLALREALSNAVCHGNLEIASRVREERGINGFNEEVELRRGLPEYCDRKVTIYYEFTGEYAEYVIEDEGPGFDVSALPDPRDQENFLRDSGRGLLIIRVHMDEVDWNEKGNSIRLRKYRVKRDNHAV